MGEISGTLVYPTSPKQASVEDTKNTAGTRQKTSVKINWESEKQMWHDLQLTSVIAEW